MGGLGVCSFATTIAAVPGEDTVDEPFRLNDLMLRCRLKRRIESWSDGFSTLLLMRRRCDANTSEARIWRSS